MRTEGMREFMIEDRADAALAEAIAAKPAKTRKAAEPKPPREPKEFQIGWPLHQMKRDPIEFGSEIVNLRDCVPAPLGRTFVEFDAAGQEFRWMAIKSGDTTMLQLCMPGEDPHSFMGSRLEPAFEYRELISRVHLGDKNAKRVRQGGKFGNLSCQYRIGDRTLMVRARVQHGMDLDLNGAGRINTVYKRTYAGVPRYWDTAIETAAKAGYAETLAGRRVQLKGDWNGPYKWAMSSTAVNYPVQGTGADQKYLALAALDDLCTELGVEFVIDLHDGLNFDAPEDKAHEFAARGKQLLDTLPYREAWGFDPPIPMPWDCKIGPSWGALREWKG